MIYELTMTLSPWDGQQHEARMLLTPEELDRAVGGPATAIAWRAEAIDRELADRFGVVPRHREWVMRGPFVLPDGG